MKLTYKPFFQLLLIAIGTLQVFSSCNKDLPVATPINPEAPSGNSILETLNDPSYSILKAAVTRAATFTSPTGNISTLLGDKTAVVTFFALDDAAFIASGIPSAAAIATLRAGFLDTVLKYHLVGGQKFTGSTVPTNSFPNSLYLQSMLLLAAPSASLPPGLRMPIFLGKAGTSLFANNIPITQADIAVANGIIHKVAGLVTPPSTTLKGLIAADPTNFSLLSAAIARADSGQVGLNKLDSVLNYAPANLTLFAPTNTAFRALFPPGTTDAQIIGALNTPSLFPVQTVRGMVAYHLLGSRAFSVNMPSTPTPINTQLVIPGPTPITVPVVIVNAGGTFTVKGVANATASNVTTANKNAINGVMHVIDQVLRPQ